MAAAVRSHTVTDRSTADPIVLRTQLDVRFTAGRNITHHVRYRTTRPGQKAESVEDSWRRMRELGQGTFGKVYMERCIKGEREQQVHAVKRIRKTEDYDWTWELRAVALFSAERVCHCSDMVTRWSMALTKTNDFSFATSLWSPPAGTSPTVTYTSLWSFWSMEISRSSLLYLCRSLKHKPSCFRSCRA